MTGKKKPLKKGRSDSPGKEPEGGSVEADAETGGKTIIPEDSADLRRRAEEIMRKQPGELDIVPPADLQRVIHELGVHQIELEMQNEELRRTQQELGASREKYFDLYDLAPVGYVTLNEKGIIMEANLTAAVMLGRERSHLVGCPMSLFIYMEDQNIYYLCYERSHQVCELRMVRKDGAPFWVRVNISIWRGTGATTGSRAVLVDISERKRI